MQVQVQVQDPAQARVQDPAQAQVRVRVQIPAQMRVPERARVRVQMRAVWDRAQTIQEWTWEPPFQSVTDPTILMRVEWDRAWMARAKMGS